MPGCASRVYLRASETPTSPGAIEGERSRRGEKDSNFRQEGERKDEGIQIKGEAGAVTWVSAPLNTRRMNTCAQRGCQIEIREQAPPNVLQ